MSINPEELQLVVLHREPTEAMIEKAVWQSNHYPVVPPSFEHRVEPLHPFAATVILREAIKAGAKCCLPEYDPTPEMEKAFWDAYRRAALAETEGGGDV